MYKQAINLLKHLDRHILVTGETGTGKLNECPVHSAGCIP